MVKLFVKKSTWQRFLIDCREALNISTFGKSHSSQVRGYGNCHIELESFPTSSFSWNAVETHLLGKSQSACSIYKGYFIKNWVPVDPNPRPYPDACSNFNHIVPVSFCGHETMLISLALYKLIHLFPVLRAFLFLKKKSVKQKSRKWDCSSDSTNAEFPHLHVPKSALVETLLVETLLVETALVETALVETALCGDRV